MANSGKTWAIVGLCLCVIETLLIVIAFATPYWVESDENSVDLTQLEKIGLWEACFKGYQDRRVGTGQTFNGCWWIFAREYNAIRKWLLPAWFVATQALMTCNVVLTMLNALFGIVLILGCLPEKAKTWATAAIVVSQNTIGLFTIISCVYFGTNAETDRTWLKQPSRRNLAYSFYLAICGGGMALLSGMCYSVYYIIVRRKGHNSTAYRAHEMRQYRDRRFRY